MLLNFPASPARDTFQSTTNQCDSSATRSALTVKYKSFSLEIRDDHRTLCWREGFLVTYEGGIHMENDYSALLLFRCRQSWCFQAQVFLINDFRRSWVTWCNVIRSGWAQGWHRFCYSECLRILRMQDHQRRFPISHPNHFLAKTKLSRCEDSETYTAGGSQDPWKIISIIRRYQDQRTHRVQSVSSHLVIWVALRLISWRKQMVPVSPSDYLLKESFWHSLFRQKHSLPPEEFYYDLKWSLICSEVQRRQMALQYSTVCTVSITLSASAARETQMA